MSSLQINNQSPLRRSSRIATIIPASYWTSIGYPEVGAQARVNLQLDIKKYCDSKDDDVSIKLIAKDSEGAIYLRDHLLVHNNMMLPHWQRLGNGLNGRTSVEDVHICGVELPVSVLDIILPTLQSMNLSRLTLWSVGCLRNKGFLHLSSFLKKNTSLKYLGFVRDEIDDMSVATSFSDAIKDHPTLETFGFATFDMNRNILRKVLEGCSRVMALHLRNCLESDNTIGTEAIANFIRDNPSTKYICLKGNNITDSDAVVLASALKKNTNLRWLDLTENNNITKDGEKNLLSALFDRTSMDSIIESNHTCIPFTYDIHNKSIQSKRMSFYEWELFKIQIESQKTSIKQTIRHKVVLELCGVDGSLFDLSHFIELPLQLMPRVLELIQEHTETRIIRIRKNEELQKDALSRLFHTLRGWELPVLFENLHGSSGKRKRRKTRR